MRARRAICCAFALAGLLGLPACGEDEDHANRERPAASINVTAAIIDGRINVSPRSFGAGPIRLIVTNQTGSAQALTFETDEVGGDSPGHHPDDRADRPVRHGDARGRRARGRLRDQHRGPRDRAGEP